MGGAVLLPHQLQRHALAAQLAMNRRPVRQRPPVLGRGRRCRIQAAFQRVVAEIVRKWPTDTGLTRPAQARPRQRSGQSRGSLQSGAWTGRQPTAAAHRGSCMGNLDWAIPAPLEKERGPANSRITQRRSSRPSTALLPWSRWTGTDGRHRLEMLVAINRKTRSPWPGARMP